MFSLIFLFFNGCLKALSDLSSEGRIFPKTSSWENKWFVQDCHLIPNKKSPWYYFGLYVPPFKERFPYSSTFLVAFTDLWHLVEAGRIITVILAIISHKCIFLGLMADFVLLWSVRTVGFTVVYEYFKRK